MEKIKGEILTTEQYELLMTSIVLLYRPAFELVQKWVTKDIRLEELFGGLLILGSIGDGFNSGNLNLYPHSLSDIDGIPLVWVGQYGNVLASEVAAKTFWAFNEALRESKIRKHLDARNRNGGKLNMEWVGELLTESKRYSLHRHTCFVTHNIAAMEMMRIVHQKEEFKLREFLVEL